ncbi:MAG TPA: hypothetical protein VMU37_02580, partial [Caulobacteraceae bacterium]|nr:hypothetical protein [Caulobacteraceae bacterium]
TSVLSSHRGGHPLAPVPIPDLSGPKSALKTEQSLPGALEARIDVITTQEFDGPEPPPAVLAGLAAYVRSLSPSACPRQASEPITAEATLADVRRAVRAALAALGRGDGDSADLMVEAARSGLGDIDERYAGAGLASEREALRTASADLAAAQADSRGRRVAAERSLQLWLDREPAWAPSVLAAEPASLYSPERLGAALRPSP